jgi:hypothetical protein
LKRSNNYVKVWVDNAVEEDYCDDEPEDKTGGKGEGATR